MSRRDLERWVADNRVRLAARGVSVLFAHGASITRAAGASWASFSSRRGNGRLIRSENGSSRLDVYAYADGARIGGSRDDHTSADQLEQIVDLLASRRVPPGPSLPGSR